MTDRHQATAYPLRLPAELKAAVTKAAFVANRSFNAEVAARLKASFQGVQGMPDVVDAAVNEEMQARGGTYEDALTRLVMLGQSKGGAVFRLTIAPGLTLKELTAALDASRTVVPPGADVHVDGR